MRGFSLLEIVGVLAVLVILGVSALVWTPSFNPARLDAAAKQVQSDIEYARQLAMTTNVLHGVQFVSAGTYTVYRSAVATPVLSPQTRQNMVVTLSSRYPGVTLQSNYTVEFNSFGAPTTGGGGFVTVGNVSGTKVIAVTNTTGSVVIQ